MVTLLSAQTGDVKRTPPIERRLSLSFSHADRRVEIDLDGQRAAIDFDQWPILVAQVDSRALTKWQYDANMPDPMGSPEVQRVVTAIDSTASFQLLLAAFDLAAFLHVIDQPQQLSRYFDALSDVLTRIGGRGGLYFPPRSLVHDLGELQLHELLINNKLCRFRVQPEGEDELWTAYVPYATPVGFATSVSRDTRKAWDEITQLYRAKRGEW